MPQGREGFARAKRSYIEDVHTLDLAPLVADKRFKFDDGLRRAGPSRMSIASAFPRRAKTRDPDMRARVGGHAGRRGGCAAAQS